MSNKFIMFFTPGYNQGTGYYYRAERDRETLINIGSTNIENVTINSFNKLIYSIFLLFKRRDSFFVSENIAASLPYAIFCCLTFFKVKRNLILIYHGSLEDLMSFRFYKIKKVIYTLIEKIVVKSGATILFVSNNMLNSYKGKYGNKETFMFSPNIPDSNFISSLNDIQQEDINRLRKDLGIPTDSYLITYCGNSQTWQKTELLIDIINVNKNNKIFFLILTKDVDFFSSKITNNNVIIKTVDNSKVPLHLLSSDLLYILRDNCETNRFSCPTKVVEYVLSNKPILISEGVGDFYDYVKNNNIGLALKSDEINCHINVLEKIDSYLLNSNYNICNDAIKIYNEDYQRKLFNNILLRFGIK